MTPLHAYSNQLLGGVKKEHGQAAAAAGRARVDCEVCSLDFHSDTEADVHRQVVHGKFLARAALHERACPVCARRYPSVAARARHLRSRHLLAGDAPRVPHPLYACADCGLLYFNRDLLLFHMRFRHEFLSHRHKVECALCGRSTHVHSHMQHHNNMHGRSVRACPLCLRVPPDRRSHMRAEHPARHACAHCPHAAATASALDRHLDTAHGRRSTGEARCPPERLASLFVSGRERRRGRYHAAFADRGLDLAGALAVCVLCQQICETVEEQRHHIESAHGHSALLPAPAPAPPPAPAPAPRLACAACDATFTTHLLLRHHVFREHGARRRGWDGTEGELGRIKRERDSTEGERDGTVGDRDSTEEKWDDTKEERDGTVGNRDSTKGKWDDTKGERENTVGDQDGQIYCTKGNRDNAEGLWNGIEGEWNGTEVEIDCTEGDRDSKGEWDASKEERDGTVGERSAFREPWVNEPTAHRTVGVSEGGEVGSIYCEWD